MLGSLESTFVYALMGNINLMLYPYITILQFQQIETVNIF